MVNQINGATMIRSGSVTTTQLNSAAGITDGQLATSYLKADGTRALTGNLSMGGNLLNSVGNGVASGDAVNLGQVQALVEGVGSKYSAHAATNTESVTISAGNATGITGLTFDGVTVAIGDFVLIPNAPVSTGACGGTTLSSQPANGLYIVTGVTTNVTLSRAADMSGSFSPFGSLVYVVAGTVWGNAGLAVTTPSTPAAFTYGSGAIAFVQWNGLADVTTGNVLTKAGNQVSVSSMATGTAIIGNAGTPTITAISGAVALGATGVVTTVPTANNTYALGSAASGYTSLYLNNGGSNFTQLLSSSPGATQALTLPATTTSDTLVGRASTDTLTNKTITAPVLSGTATGTYTLAGTPTITSPTISGPTLSGTVAGTYTIGGTPTWPSNSIPLASLANAAYNTTPTASTLAEWDANKNLQANAFAPSLSTITSAAGTTTLNISTATGIIVVTGTTTQTILLPSTSVPMGMTLKIINESTGIVTLQSSGANTITTLAGAGAAPFQAAEFSARIATPTTAANWDYTLYSTGGGGSVTAVSVVSTNGFTGTSSGGATPALTLTTSVTGLLKGNGTAISAAAASDITAHYANQETPSGTINGTTTAFGLAHSQVLGTEQVFLDGILQRAGGTDYTATASTITFGTAPAGTDNLLVSYWY